MNNSVIPNYARNKELAKNWANLTTTIIVTIKLNDRR